MSGRGAWRLAGLLILTLSGTTAQAEDRSQCQLEAMASGAVRQVIDGRTFTLADGRAVRLAGIEVPPAARNALESLIAGRELALKRLGAETDRYGHVPAFAFVPDNDHPVQELLLAGGLARVAAQVGDMACASELLGFEHRARAARLGLWADPVYGLRQAEHPSDVLAQRGRFTVVEGRVLSVRESGGTIYVNFGRRWSEDFTVTVPKRSERSFSAAGRELKKLSGKTVRIRGVIEERGGPWIEANRPEQIEIAERD